MREVAARAAAAPAGAPADEAADEAAGTAVGVAAALQETGQKAPVFSRGMNGLSNLQALLKKDIKNDLEYQHEQQSVHLVVSHIIWCPNHLVSQAASEGACRAST